MTEIINKIYYVGVNDRNKHRFEGLWPLPNGVSYNSYIIDDEKVALVDTVEVDFFTQFLENIHEVIGDREIDYLIINHMEPDHSGSIALIKKYYPNIEIPCDNLSDRKDLMLAQSDIFVALPGGIGTLDEIFTIAAAHTIGYHHKMVILYNMKGFWNSTIALLDDMAEKSMIRGDWRDVIEVADNLEELAKMCI
jgi:uncharacterized protein (TIGR00730 family)